MNLIDIEEYGIYILYTLIYIAYAVVLKYVLNMKAASHYSADEQIADGNLAVGLRRIGAQLGLAIAMMGVLSGSSAESLASDLIDSAVYGLVAVIFIISSLVVTDRLVMSGINNQSALKNNNHAVGTVEFGMLVATGIIAHSSIAGDGGGILSSVVYFIAGQITLVALVVFYEKVVLKNFSIVGGISDNKLSSGIYLSGKIISYSLILKSAIMGNGSQTDVSVLAIEYITVAVSGMILLYIFELVIDKLIVTTSNVSVILEENRIVPALQLSASKISIALILSHAIL